MDPCIFIIDKYAEGQASSPPTENLDLDSGLPEGVHRSWMLIHTDDCDAYGTSLDVLHEINNAMNDEWSTELVDRSYILGVKRDLVTDDPKGWHVHLSMTSFIEDLGALFQKPLDQKFGKRRVRTPFPEHLLLTKASKPREGEVDRNILRGYQRLVGSLLWCVRHVAPIASYGMSQLYKLMATPTDEAWEAALHLLSTLCKTRTRGFGSVRSTTSHLRS